MHVYGEIIGTLSGGVTLEAELTIPSAAGVPAYEGSYTFTPSDSTQTIVIEGMKALEDIVINPIPQNYGLITWDGSIITVS